MAPKRTVKKKPKAKEKAEEKLVVEPVESIELTDKQIESAEEKPSDDDLELATPSNDVQLANVKEYTKEVAESDGLVVAEIFEIPELDVTIRILVPDEDVLAYMQGLGFIFEATNTESIRKQIDSMVHPGDVSKWHDAFAKGLDVQYQSRVEWKRDFAAGLVTEDDKPISVVEWQIQVLKPIFEGIAEAIKKLDPKDLAS